MEVLKIVEVKNGKDYAESCRFEGPIVYEHLASDLIYKYIHKSPMYKSIKRKNNFDGTQNIVITYDNGVRSTYRVRN